MLWLEASGHSYLATLSPITLLGVAFDAQLVPLALVLFRVLAYNRYKESTHSFVWMP